MRPGGNGDPKTIWAVALVTIASLLLLACRSTAPTTPQANPPARLETIDGTDLKRVVLTAEAAARIGIKTTPVREVQVLRKRNIGGEVIALDAGATLLIRATPSDIAKLDRRQVAQVRPVTRTGAPAPAATSLTARASDPPPDSAPGTSAMYYTIDGRAHGLALGQRVMLEIPLVGGSAMRKVMPYSGVLYDLGGATWAYTQTGPLAYVRHRLTVDYIEGDDAVLIEGPATGTEVVSTGATELFGTESKVGK